METTLTIGQLIILGLITQLIWYSIGFISLALISMLDEAINFTETNDLKNYSVSKQIFCITLWFIFVPVMGITYFIFKRTKKRKTL